MIRASYLLVLVLAVADIKIGIDGRRRFNVSTDSVIWSDNCVVMDNNSYKSTLLQCMICNMINDM